MKAIYSLSIVVALAASGAVQAQAPSGQYGCLGESLASCKALIEKRYRIVGGNYAAALAAVPKFDVSGKRMPGPSGGYMMIKEPTGRDSYDLHTIKFGIDSEGKVNALEFDLPRNPASAATEEEFDRTKIFTLSSLIIPQSGCNEIVKINFYKFFYEKLRPTIDGPTRDGYVGVGSASDEYKYRSKQVELCGAFVSYERQHGIATIYMGADNPSGRFDDISITFKSKAD